MANKVTIDVEARFIDNVTDEAKDAAKSFESLEKAAEDANKDLKDLGKRKVNPKVDADTNRATKKLNDMDKKLNKLGKSKTEAKLTAKDKASALIDKVTSKLKSATGKTHSFMVKLRDSNVLSGLNKMSSGLKNLTHKAWSVAVKIKDTFTAPLTKLKNMLFNVKTLIAGIASAWAATKLVINPINVADAYSSAKIGFSTLLGESGGQQMMDDLDEFAKATPFKTSGVIANAQKMMAMGWDTDTLLEDLEVIGNAAAATGKLDQGLESIVRAMSQIKTKGKLSTEELNQLAEAGIAAKAMLAENLGYGTGDQGIAKMTADLEKGAIQSDVAIQALIAGMQKYDGMMDSMANETVDGLIAQMQDVFEINIVRRWGQGLQDGAKKGFGTVIQLLDESEEALSRFGDMLYELGHTASNWVAGKLQGVVDKIIAITDTYEFQNADLKGKISMLWDGLVADPLKEWWENGGEQKTAETAGKIGSWMGKMLTKGLLAIFGATDVLDEGIGTEAGSSIAGSFLDGFLDNFDGQAITDAFVDAVGNVWGALPWWAKILLGGYGVGKVAGWTSTVAGGIAKFIGTSATAGAGDVIVKGSGLRGLIGGNVTNAAGDIIGASGLIGKIGSTGNAMVSGTGILGKLASTGYGMMGGPAAAAGMSGGAAALLGSLPYLGGIAAGASVIKGGIDLYKGYTTDDEVEAKASKTSGWTTLGGVGAGAAIGTMILPGVGTAIGAGIGGIAGWIGGNAWADKIRETDDAINNVSAATAECENEQEKLEIRAKMVWQNMKDHFGDIKLSMSEIEALTKQIVWGDDLVNYEQFTTAAQTAEASLKSLKSASETTNKWMWKASLGMKFNEDEIASIATSFDEYITSAINYAENKHYEFTAAVGLLVDVESKEGKSILSSGNAFYGGMLDKLNSLGAELSDKVKVYLEGGVINFQEHEEIINLQNQIAEITAKLSNAETAAELDLIRVKFGDGNLDKDSFDSFMAQMQTALDERIAANDEAYLSAVTSINLQLAQDGLTDEQKAELNKQLETLTAEYTGKVDEVKAKILNVELEIIAESYAAEGITTDKLQTALMNSLELGVDPIEWTVDQARVFLNTEDLTEDSALALSKYLSEIVAQGVVDIEIAPGETKVKDGFGNNVETAVVDYIPGSLETVMGVDVKADYDFQKNTEILVEDFGIETEQAAIISFLLTADCETVKDLDMEQYLMDEFGIGLGQATKIKTVFEMDPELTITERLEILSSDFGIPESQAATILWMLTGEEAVQNTIDLLIEDFGVPPELADTIALLLTGEKEILAKIDTTTLAAELGVPPEVAETIITKLSGAKSIEEKVSVLGSELVDSTTVDQTITVRLKTKVVKIAEKVKSWFGGGDEDGEGYRGGIFGGDSAMDAFARGGLTDNGGIVGGSTRFIRVNEESPEMIIPLSDQRRARALKLWAQAGNIMGVPGFARGGIVGGNGNDEGIRFRTYGSSESTGGRAVHVSFGDIKLEINVSGSDRESIVEAIKAQAGELADYIVGQIADALETEFENTPVRGGAA